MTTWNQPAAGFVPANWGETDGSISWVDASAETFPEPFASQTLKRLREGNASGVAAHWTSLLNSGPAHEVAGIVFHMTRCGSTWVCQGLRALDRSLVFSEPPALEGAWVAEGPDAEPIDPTLRRAMIQGSLGALGRLGRLQGRDVFVKPTSWALESGELLLASAPRARGIFLFRHPVEVMVSLLEVTPGGLKDGEHFARRARRLGMTSDFANARDRLETLAIVTRRALLDALALRERIRFVSYESLTQEGLEPLLRHFRPDLSEDECSRIQALSTRYAKDPTGQREFAADGEAKRARADARVWEAYDELLREPYEACLALSSGGCAADAS